MREASLAMSLATLSFMLTVIWGGPLLRVLRHYKIGKDPVEDRIGTSKMNLTMGGVMFIAPVLLFTILLNFAPLLGLRASASVCCQCRYGGVRCPRRD
jgi:phospho-N-acetylmuramoyl-pentapeptide-transferase